MSIFLSSLLLYLREARSTSPSLQHVSVHKLGSCQHTAQRKKQKGSSKPRAVSGSHPEHTGKEKEGCNFLKCSVSGGPHFHAPVLNAWAESEAASTPRTPVWLFGLFQMSGSFYFKLNYFIFDFLCLRELYLSKEPSCYHFSSAFEYSCFLGLVRWLSKSWWLLLTLMT